jgi:hypothetical protein
MVGSQMDEWLNSEQLGTYIINGGMEPKWHCRNTIYYLWGWEHVRDQVQHHTGLKLNKICIRKLLGKV